MKTTKSSQATVPDQLKKLFIVSTLLVYAASVFMNLTYMLSPQSLSPDTLVQLLLMSIPLIIAAVVYMTRSDSKLTLDSLFAVLVATFSLFMLYIAFATVFTPLLLEIAYNNALGSGTAMAVGSMYSFINTVAQLVVTVLLVGGFLFYASRARKRGEW